MSSSSIEEEHVHKVYEQIATHFSQTRYKPWPVVERFLLAQPPGSLVADVGCGNGKYLNVNRKNITYIASDYSLNLCNLASQMHPHTDVIRADATTLAYRNGLFDAVISIAVLHHLSTTERRQQAIKELLRIVKPKGGRVLAYVWAWEQGEGSKRRQLVDEAGGERDLLVPWRMQSNEQKKQQTNEREQKEEQTFMRYYHMFERGELEECCRQAAKAENIQIALTESGYDKDNWYCVIERL